MDERGPEELERGPEDRLHRPGAGLARAGIARSPLRQGPGVGLVRRPVLASPDVLCHRMVIGLISFVIWELRHPNPIVNLRLLGDRNFLASGLIIYVAFAVLYGSNVDTPQMLQELFGYDAFHAGLILSPSAFFTMAMMPIVGFLLGRKVDARWHHPARPALPGRGIVLAGAPGPLHVAIHVRRSAVRPDDGRRLAVRTPEQRGVPLSAQGPGQQRRPACSTCCATREEAWESRS